MCLVANLCKGSDTVIGHSSDQETATRFESTVLLHLDAAYNLARWLSRDDHSAEDIVQIAIMRAYKFFDGFRGEDARAWLLTIVRNTYFTSSSYPITKMIDWLPEKELVLVPKMKSQTLPPLSVNAYTKISEREINRFSLF